MRISVLKLYRSNKHLLGHRRKPPQPLRHRIRQRHLLRPLRRHSLGNQPLSRTRRPRPANHNRRNFHNRLNILSRTLDNRVRDNRTIIHPDRRRLRLRLRVRLRRKLLSLRRRNSRHRSRRRSGSRPHRPRSVLPLETLPAHLSYFRSRCCCRRSKRIRHQTHLRVRACARVLWTWQSG